MLTHCGDDRILMPQDFTISQGRRVSFQTPPFISTKYLGRQWHIQLHGGGFGRQEREAVLSNAEGQCSAVVPFHVELTIVIDMHQRSFGAGWHRVIRIVHLPEFDS